MQRPSISKQRRHYTLSRRICLHVTYIKHCAFGEEATTTRLQASFFLSKVEQQQQTDSFFRHLQANENKIRFHFPMRQVLNTICINKDDATLRFAAAATEPIRRHCSSFTQTFRTIDDLGLHNRVHLVVS